jgi:hypothetical protein
LEILVRLCASDLFGPDWTLIAQQLSLPSGRLDLLFVAVNWLSSRKGGLLQMPSSRY